jgi:glyoxylase-like metal-dependent hydrolase (beta-lactamase superfamily II)
MPTTIDCNYLAPQFAAAYLIAESDRALFVENNTAHATPFLLQALKETGLKPEQVEYLIVTHIHLDHAGGTSKLLQACPNAKVLAHPRAAPHLIDPTKLITSARHVYGDANFDRLYGEILPIDSARVRIMQDQEVLPFGSRSLKFIYTRGHANHHFCIFDSESEGIFTGDSFGLAYPALQKSGLFIFPSTSPTDFDPNEARLSIQKILDSGAKRAFLTHYGSIGDLKGAADQLRMHLDFSEKLLESAIQSSEPDAALDEFCQKQIYSYFQTLLSNQGLATPEVWDLIKMDLELNAAGIAHIARKRRLKLS